MPKVKVVVDSTADIPRNLADELDIGVVPLTVHFGDTAYVDWLELTPLEFYDLLATSPDHPYTTPPAVEQFQTVYDEALRQGQDVVSLHISGGLSETVEIARRAAAGLKATGRVEVVDSRVVSMALALPALAAARAAQAGAPLEEVASEAAAVVAASRGKAFFAVDTLDYLARNGRIGRAQAILGALLAVKPVLCFEDGVVAPYEKVRGDKKVIPRLVDLVRELSGSGRPKVMGIVQANCLDKAVALRDAVVKAVDPAEVLICELGAVVGTHGGPGTIGLAFY